MTTRQPKRLPVDVRWTSALADMCKTLERAQYSPATIDRVARHLRMFATQTGLGPWDPSAEQLSGWLDALDCTDRARSGYRTSLRTFYRWAYKAGRVLADPTEGQNRRAKRRSAPPTWHTALDGYCRYLRAEGCPSATIRLRRYQVTRLACELSGAGPWEVEDEDLIEWIGGHRWSRETARSARSGLRDFYDWARMMGHIDHNPAATLPVIKPTPPNPHPAREDDYRAAVRLADRRTRLMLRLAGDLGLRRAEVAKVHTRDLSFDGAGWWLSVTGKGGKARRLPVPNGLARELTNRPSGYIFPGQINGHLSPGTVGKIVTAALPSGTTMHALRHRFATQTYGVARDVFTVQQLLGHASPVTTQRYVQIKGDDLRRHVDLVSLDHTAGQAR